MREKTLVWTIAFLLTISLASAAFTADVDELQNVVFPGQAATYQITITNYNVFAERYSISSLNSDYNLFITSRPDSSIQPEEQGVYQIQLSPRSSASLGTHRVPLQIRAQNSGTTSTVSPIIAIRDPTSRPGVYAPSIALSVSETDQVDPRSNLRLDIGLRNRNARVYSQDELMVVVTSDFFSHSYNTSLGSVVDADSEKTTRRIIEIDDYKGPGTHPLTVQVLVEGVVVSSYEATFEIASYSDIEQVVAQDRSFFKTTTTYYLTNNGNVMQEAVVEYPLGVFEQVFTSSSHNYEVVSVDDTRSLRIQQEMQSQEEIAVTITHNYRLLVLLLLLAIASVIGYYLMRSPMVLAKEAEVIASIEEGESHLKTRLFIKNRSSQTLRNIRVVDRVSGLAEVIDNNALGTLRPTKVVKKKSQGTLIRWDIEALEPFEERIISYEVKTPLALVGDITLPSLKVTFEQEGGRQRTAHSNNVSIRRSE